MTQDEQAWFRSTMEAVIDDRLAPMSYKANRTVIEVFEINHRGSAFLLALPEELEEVTANPLSRDPDEKLVAAIAWKIHKCLPAGWSADAIPISGSSRPRTKVTLETCFDVVRRELVQRGITK